MGLHDAITKEVDLILLAALSRAGLKDPVERAVAAGIPVVTCMATVAGDGPTVDVSRNIPLQGYDSAKGLAERLGGQGKVTATVSSERLENINRIFARMHAGDIQGRIVIDFRQ